MDVKMNVLDELNLERIDTTDYVSQFKSMTYIDANTIYVSTFWNVNEGVGPFHNTVTLFLINETLDLLGRCDLFMESFFNVLHIQPTSDKGCIIQGYLDNVSHRKPVMYKFNRIDFEIMTDVLKEEDFSKVSAYPNPVSSVLHIEAAAFKNKYVNVEIFDMLGGRYLDKDVYKDGDILSIDVSLLKDGAYVYCLSDNRQKIKGMFVKE